MIVCQDGLVPRNRREQPREQKRRALVDAATRLFLESGYDGVSMAAIAKAAQVTPTNLYWYFEDKDDLFTAVGEEFLASLVARYADAADLSLAEQFVWLVDAMRPVKGLMATVHARVSVSPRIAEWHRNFHARMEALFEIQLPHSLPAPERAAEVHLATFAIEGAITHDLDEPSTLRLCRAIADRLTSRTDVGYASGRATEPRDVSQSRSTTTGA